MNASDERSGREEEMHYSHLFSSGKIGKCNLRNRIIMPLFPTKYATGSKVTPKMLAFYRARAKGGAALIVLDCPCLDYPLAYKGSQELRFDEEEYAAGIRELLHVIQSQGAKAFMHLNYPKERMVREETPGAKKKGDLWAVSLAQTMSVDEADEIIEIMASGANKAKEIGYDGVDIQASYGDLIAQLLSPLLNKRKDELAGSTENRTRFLIRLVRRVKDLAGQEFPVMVKLVCDEFVPNGLGVEEGKKIARLGEAAGADAIVANGGNKSTKFMTIPSHEHPPGTLVHLARQVKDSVNIPVVAIGKINSPKLADDIIGQRKADFVAMARALVADPDFPRKAESGMAEEIRGCVYCLEDCAEKGVPGVGRCCTVNPFAGHEHIWEVSPATKRKKVLVVGGGPSGMQAAIIASQRGHGVELWEKSAALGGQLKLASLAPFKEEMSEVLRYLRHCVERSSLKVRLGCEADVTEILATAPDVVILATGSRPGGISLPGIDSEIVSDVTQIYRDGGTNGEKIIVIGGGETGCETADWLARPGREVTVVEILPQVLPRMNKISRERLLSRLSEKKVNLLTETRITSIEENKVHFLGKDGEDLTLLAGRVIIAIDPLPEDALLKALDGGTVEVIAVGDAAAPGDIGAALRSATKVALKI
jgi:2,4-dienoyl-CoA reductase-like NADH-dependent reductase (Old Yellow Enzyme family)/siroheme synthase (precorrin-2 oxidase/ferrochelatase)